MPPEINHFARATGWPHPAVWLDAAYPTIPFGAPPLAGWWSARRSGDPRALAAALRATTVSPPAAALNQILSAAVARPRPNARRRDPLVLAHYSRGPSFPSDHDTLAGAAAAGLLLLSRIVGAIAAAAAVLMAGARVSIAAHHPSDVLARLLLGGLVAVPPYALAHTVVARPFASTSRARLRPLCAPHPTPLPSQR